MPQIYDRPVHELIRELIGERLSSPMTILTRQDTLAWFRQKYPKVRPGTVAAHLLKLATNDRTRLHYDPKPGYDDWRLPGGCRSRSSGKLRNQLNHPIETAKTAPNAMQQLVKFKTTVKGDSVDLEILDRMITELSPLA
ncbi:MAG: hypothetical protein M3O61_06655 [Gemmatimonadota bacterium]|nr:hypothetical protein [Gemmatimonadota bacterium]